VEVVEGDARNVLCDAVEKHHASILVLGSHGYGAIKRYKFILISFIIQLHYNYSWYNSYTETCEWSSVYTMNVLNWVLMFSSESL
jgi:hypothetical protein